MVYAFCTLQDLGKRQYVLAGLQTVVGNLGIRMAFLLLKHGKLQAHFLQSLAESGFTILRNCICNILMGDYALALNLASVRLSIALMNYMQV